MELKEIFNRLAQKDGFECGEGQDEKSIQQLEEKMKIRFPDEYKAFLGDLGYALWNGGKIYGISKKLVADVVHRNQLVREGIKIGEFRKLPEDAFLIEDYGDAFFMLFGNDSKRKGQVGLYLTERPDWEEKNWKSFKEFLEEYCL